MMEKCKILFLMILMTCTKGSSSKDIHVSKNQASRDDSNCGSLYRPCYTLAHALWIANDSDTVHLDVFYDFNQTATLTIDKRLTIRSYQNTKTLKKQATIKFDKLLHLLVEFSQDASLNNVEIYFEGIRLSVDGSLFELDTSCRVKFVNCTFKMLGFPNTYQLFNFKGNGLQRVDVLDSVFYQFGGYHLPLKIRKNMKSTKEMGVLTKFVHLSVINSTFYGTSILIFDSINYMKLENCLFYNTNIALIDHDYNNIHIMGCRFENSSLGIGNNDEDDSIIIIEKTIFKNGIFGALSIHSQGTIEIKSCFFINNTISEDLKNMLLVKEAAALTVRSTSIHPCINILDCQFINNSAPMNWKNSLLITTTCPQNKSCNGTYIISNTIIKSGNYHKSKYDTPVFITTGFGFLNNMFINNTSIQCKSGQTLSFVQNSILPNLLINCKTCDILTYNTNIAEFKVADVQKQIYTASNLTCHKCPYQASCNDGIKSKGNYWGSLDPDSGIIDFILCPSSYCCRSIRTCASYNTCHQKRAERLCGDCLKGHSLSLFSQNQCVPTNECENSWMSWPSYILGVFTVCFFLLYIKSIWNFLKSISTKIGNQKNKESDRESFTDPNESMYSPLLDSKEKIQIEVRKSHQASSSKFSGIIKTAFFFYQTASISRIEASAKNEYTAMPYLVGFLTSFFNIRIDVTKSVMTLCPFKTSNAVVMEAFKSSVPFVCLMLIALLMLITKAAMMFNQYQTSAENSGLSRSLWRRALSHLNQQNDLHQPPPTQLTSKDSIEPAPSSTPQRVYGKSFMCRLKGGYVNLMVLGYSSAALFCFRTVYCVDINDASYLYIQASVRCYQSWQHLVIVFISLWIVPFPLVLYAGCRLLRSYRISPNEYLLILTIPPIAMYYMAVRPICDGRRCFAFDEYIIQERDYILSVLNEPFRSTSGTRDEEQQNALIWEPILIGRRLILIVMTTFVLSPIVKLYPVGLLLILFAVHDHVTKPYSSEKLNFLQFLSTLTLIMLLLLNMFWATTNDVDLVESHQYFVLGEIFLVAEVVLLMLPFIAGLCYLAYKTIIFLIRVCIRKQVD